MPKNTQDSLIGAKDTQEGEGGGGGVGNKIKGSTKIRLTLPLRLDYGG